MFSNRNRLDLSLIHVTTKLTQYPFIYLGKMHASSLISSFSSFLKHVHVVQKWVKTVSNNRSCRSIYIRLKIHYLMWWLVIIGEVIKRKWTYTCFNRFRTKKRTRLRWYEYPRRVTKWKRTKNQKFTTKLNTLRTRNATTKYHPLLLLAEQEWREAIGKNSAATFVIRFFFLV